MTLALRLLCAAFACYRLAALLAIDDGPYHFIDRIRRAFGRKAAEGGATWKTLAELVYCPYCSGVWFGLPLALCVLWPFFLSDVVLIWFAITGLQAFLQSLTRLISRD